MSFVQRVVVPVVTDASGNATAFSPVLTGKISTIRYVADASVPFSNGVDFAITAEATGETIWTQNDVNASATVAPRQAISGTDGVASLYAAAGKAVQDKIALANDRVQIAISSGGNTKSGVFHIVME